LSDASLSPHVVKLGGSLITDKNRPLTPRPLTIQRLAVEIAAARAARPGSLLLLSHGSGSYGHVVGQAYRTRDGVGGSVASDPRGWRGFAETGHVAAQLNRLVMAALLRAGLPAVSFPPSALVRCRDGEIVTLNVAQIAQALAVGLVPVVFGDVAFDEAKGATIVSTEQVLAALTPSLRPLHLSLVGIADGVFESDPLRHPGARSLPHLNIAEVQTLAAAFGGSHGIDVTGGMASKLKTMAALVQDYPALNVHLLSGEIPGQLQRHLCDPELPLGTTLTAN
jgi:isopentenyl phosphate kinase